MTISVTPVIPATPANSSKIADTDAPEVPFVKVLSKEIAAHQINKAAAAKTDPKTTQDAPGMPVVEASTPPAQLTAEMLAMMGQVPINAPVNHPVTEPDPAAQLPTLNNADKNAGKSASNLADLLAKSTATSAQELNSHITPLDTASSEPITNKAGNKIDAGNFTELLKGAETDRAHAAFTSPDAPSILPAQTAAVNLALQNPAMMLTDKLSARVGTPAWEQSLSQKVVWMANGTQQIASLTLNPPDLGPLQIVLSVNNDQANATFIASQPEVRLAIEAAMPKLREMMSDAGIQLGQANVSAGDPRQQNNAQQDPASRQNTGGNLSADTISLNNAPITTKITTGLGLVNTFV
ncbi:MAG: flagellar hook-length control protein FliK [Sulfuriferula sp.]